MTSATPGRVGFLALLGTLCLASPARAQGLGEWEAVGLAFDRNPALKATVLETSAAARALEAAAGERPLVFRVGLGGGYGGGLGGAPDERGDLSVDLGLGWTSNVGTAVDLGVAGSWGAAGSGRDPADPNLDAPGSTYGAAARLQVTQPLLRGAGRDVGEASLRAARLQVTAAGHSQAAAASQLVEDVLAAYWELWYAEEALEVNRAAFALAERQLDEAETRVSALGTMAPTEALRFASELASIEESLAQASSEVGIRSAELGRLLGVSPEEALALRTADEAPSGDLEITAEQASELARQQSSELLALRAELEATGDRVALARDATLPRLDLTTTLSVDGLWRDRSDLAGTLPGDDLGLSALVGLSLELPVGNGRAQAQLAESRIRFEAAELRLEARERLVETQVTSGLLRLETARRRAALAERSVGLARRLAEAEGEALRLGTSTAFQALEAQASLRQTELRRLRALVDRTESEIALQHLTGQLLLAYAERSGTL